MFFSLCLENFPQPLAWLSPHPVGLALISTNMEFLANTVRINTACLLPKSPFCFRVGSFPVHCSVVLVMAFPMQYNTLVGCHPSASCSQLCVQCLAVSGFGWHLGGNYMTSKPLAAHSPSLEASALLLSPDICCCLSQHSSVVCLLATHVWKAVWCHCEPGAYSWTLFSGLEGFYTLFQLAVGTMMREPESPKQSSLKLAPCD